MKARHVMLALGAGALACGCAALPPESPFYRTYMIQASKCSGASCPVRVWVFLGKVYTNIDELSIDKDNRDVTIHWHLILSPGYELRTDSVEFKADTPNDGQFSRFELEDPNGNQVPGGKNLKTVDKNTNDKTYRYAIKVYPENSNTPIQLDPTIKNQG